jgi:hypothetical protein
MDDHVLRWAEICGDHDLSPDQVSSRSMTNHIPQYKKWYVLQDRSTFVMQIGMDRFLIEIPACHLNSLWHLTNISYRGEFLILIKFFIPDTRCLKANGQFLRRANVPIWAKGSSKGLVIAVLICKVRKR